jgi:glyoxylase-like metal-dependent hydrolase (beta-lactamase superfamily II)
MHIEHWRHPRWLANTYLVFERAGGKAVLVDAGGPLTGVLARVEELRLEVTHLLMTHHHFDHTTEAGAARAAWGCALCGGSAERELFAGEGLTLDVPLAHGAELETGELHIQSLWTPGHTVGQCAYLINGQHVFTGDTLFRDSVGGTRVPGHATFEALRESLLSTLLSLPADTQVHPGHMEATTIGREAEHNPFLRAFRGLDQPTGRDGQAYGRPARILLEARDYDGGTKAWVRFHDTGELATVPGSRLG